MDENYWRSKKYDPSDLPGKMIGLESTEGQRLLKESTLINKQCVERAVNQVCRSFCGPASLAIAINALNGMAHVKREAETWITEDDIVSSSNEMANDAFKKYKPEEDGMNLDQLGECALLHGFGVNVYYVVDAELEANLDMAKIEKVKENADVYFLRNVGEFRDFVKDHITRPMTGLVANYDMKGVGYKYLYGHFSPLAGYNEESDCMLIMDTWPDTPSAWVKTEDLYKAHATLDDDSGLPRGILHFHVLV